MKSGVKVTWHTSMGVSSGTTISSENKDGFILVAMDSQSNIRPTFYILVSILNVIS